MAVSVIKSDYKNVTDKITISSGWTELMKRVWVDGNTLHFVIEASGTVVGGTQYIIATIASGYRPKTTYSFTGHTTNSSFVPQGVVNAFIWGSGDIVVRASNSNGSYVFISGEYPLSI